MARLLKDKTLIDTWTAFLEEHYKSEIESIALEYPEKRSLYFDYWDIDRVDPKLTEMLINQPYKAIFNAEEALENIDVAVENKLKLHFRVVNLPDTNKIVIRKIRANHLGTFVAVEGLVKKRTEVRPKLQVGAFQCQKCGAVLRMEQEEDILKEPSECYEDQGGCGRVSSFELLTNLSEHIDSQKIEIQENPEELRGGAQPERISVYLEDDLVGILEAGDRVIINGILHSQQRRRGQSQLKLTSFNKVMDAYSIERQEHAFEEVEVTPEDEKEILKISKDPEIYTKMKGSIAPTIYGMDVEKDSLVLQLFGGMPKTAPDGTEIRGDIHMLLVGDPGTAKSQLLAYMHRLAPRSVLASGSASTRAGLTAAAVRDTEFGEGQWTIEGGAMVLANDGLACIDEFDKMNDEARGSMHEAMEQQQISVAKAGLTATLKSKCSVLAAANPKQGRLNEYKSLPGQINIQTALLSRFDLIFSIKDKPNETTDTRLSKHILRTHRGIEIAENILKCEKTEYPTEERDALLENIKPVFEPEFLRKYVAYGKRNIFPVLTDEAADAIREYYVKVRRRSDDNDSVPFTPRQLECFVRLAEASARVRLSNKATIDDAKRAIFIVTQYLKRVGTDPETGNFDIDILETGVTHSQQKRMNTIYDIISNLGKSSDEGADTEDIVTEAEIAGIGKEETEDSIKHLVKDKQIFKMPKGGYKTNV